MSNVVWTADKGWHDGPEIHRIVKARGVAGQVAFTATVEYPGEPSHVVTFVGHGTYPGPVVMMSATAEVFVTDPGRFGLTLDEAWVRRFFA